MKGTINMGNQQTVSYYSDNRRIKKERRKEIHYHYHSYPPSSRRRERTESVRSLPTGRSARRVTDDPNRDDDEGCSSSDEAEISESDPGYMELKERSAKETAGHSTLTTAENFKAAVTILERHGAVFITGVVRSDMGRALLDHYGKQGFTQIVMQEKSEWMYVKRGGGKKVVLLDISDDESCRELFGEGSGNDKMGDLDSVIANRSLLVVTTSILVLKEKKHSDGCSLFPNVSTLDLDTYRSMSSDKNTFSRKRIAIKSNTARQLTSKHSDYNQNALQLACRQYNTPMVSLLLGISESELQRYLDTDYMSIKHILWQAVSSGNTTLVERLLQQGANPDTRDEVGRTVLHVASHKNHADVMEVLIQHGADVNAVDLEKQTPLHEVCVEGHVHAATVLINHSARVLSCNTTGYTPFHIAGKYNHSSLMCLLLPHVENADIPAEVTGHTTLHIACMEGNVKAVNTLVENGASLNATDISGATPLHAACLTGKVEAVCTLLRLSADVDAADTSGQTPLHYACLNNHTSVIDVLVQYKADLHKQDKQGHTALHLACRHGLRNTVVTLLQHNADPMVRDNDRSTALHLACRHSHSAVVYALLYTDVEGEESCVRRRGVTVNVMNRSGQSPLHLACQADNIVTVWILLEAFGYKVSHVVDGNTPLHVACSNGNWVTTQAFIKYRSQSIGDKNALGWTPLHTASFRGHSRLIDKLFTPPHNTYLYSKEYMNVINSADVRGQTPLHLACENGDEQAVKIFLMIKATLGTTGLSGETPLHISCRKGHAGVVKLLLEYGARTSKKDKKGQVPLHVASYYGHADVVQTLLAHRQDYKQSDGASFYCPCQQEKFTKSKTAAGCTALVVATQNGHGFVASLLIEHGADVNTSDSVGCTPLHHACTAGHVDTVKMLLDKGNNVDCLDEEKDTALHCACAIGDVDITRLLLDRGADTKGRNKKGETALTKAIHNGHLDIVKLLVEHGCSLDSVDVFRISPLAEVCTSSYKRMFRFLADSGAILNFEEETFYVTESWRNTEVIEELIKCDVNKTDNVFVSRMLTIVCNFDNTRVVSMLLDKGARVYRENDWDIRALHAASSHGCTEIVKLLIARGSEVNSKDPAGNTPLHVACRCAKAGTAQELIRNGADLDVMNSQRRTALLEAVSLNCGNTDIVKLLIDYGADVNKQDENWNTPLHEAYAKGSEEVSALLLTVCDKVETKNVYGYTALHLACTGQRVSTVRHLLERGFDVHSTDCEGNTALHFACEHDREDIVITLLAHGAKLDVKNYQGQSPLHGASLSKQAQIIRLYLKHGADVHNTDKEGNTPLHLACIQGNETIMPEYNKDSAIVLLILLDSGAEVNVKNKAGRTPLHEACSTRNMKCESPSGQRI